MFNDIPLKLKGPSERKKEIAHAHPALRYIKRGVIAIIKHPSGWRPILKIH
jgi:hypothetical protein